MHRLRRALRRVARESRPHDTHVRFRADFRGHASGRIDTRRWPPDVAIGSTSQICQDLLDAGEVDVVIDDWASLRLIEMGEPPFRDYGCDNRMVLEFPLPGPYHAAVFAPHLGELAKNFSIATDAAKYDAAREDGVESSRWRAERLLDARRARPPLGTRQSSSSISGRTAAARRTPSTKTGPRKSSSGTCSDSS